jgi:hypothetical protein
MAPPEKLLDHIKLAFPRLRSSTLDKMGISISYLSQIVKEYNTTHVTLTEEYRA